MDKTELVKYAQLDLLLELDRICKKNEINYFLAGGTLIGAIRHNGFIPWDDDIDVGMLRDDYEKFKKACEKDLSSEYAQYDWHIDPASPLPFLKLKIKGTHYREEISDDSEMNDAIFIDVFPLDNAPNSIFKQKIQNFQLYIVKKILFVRCGFSIAEIGKAKEAKKILYALLKAASKVLPISKWKEREESIQTKYNKSRTDCVVNLCGSYSYAREKKKREILENLTIHEFEGYHFSIPQEYDVYLTEVYGDYMKLPPENERHGKHAVSVIDLGNYKIHCREIENI